MYLGDKPMEEEQLEWVQPIEMQFGFERKLHTPCHMYLSTKGVLCVSTVSSQKHKWHLHSVVHTVPLEKGCFVTGWLSKRYLLFLD